MKKKALWLGLILFVSSLAQGCCWYDRPYVFPRLHWWRCGYGGCCGMGGYGGDCGCGPLASEHYFGTPIPMNQGGPMMPGAQPLSRATFPQK
jgi:hypothetical protein